MNKSMEQSPAQEVNSFSGSQKTHRMLRNQNVHYRIHKSPPPVPILGQINAYHAPQPISQSAILILSYYLRLSLPT
jgi:hypothetical protein